jgi:hypothetical protein
MEAVSPYVTELFAKPLDKYLPPHFLAISMKDVPCCFLAAILYLIQDSSKEAAGKNTKKQHKAWGCRIHANGLTSPSIVSAETYADNQEENYENQQQKTGAKTKKQKR